MNLRRGHSRRLVAAIAAIAMCGAGLAMGAGVAQANPQILVDDQGRGDVPSTNPIESFPAVFVLPPNVVVNFDDGTSVDHGGWLWTQLSNEQTAGLRDSGLAQAAVDAKVPVLKHIGYRLVEQPEDRIAAGACVSFALNPSAVPAALAGDDEIHVTTSWRLHPNSC